MISGVRSVAQSTDRRQGVGRVVHVGQAELVAPQSGRHPILHDIAQAQVGVAVAGRHQRRGDHVLHNPAAEPVHLVRVYHIGRQRVRTRTAVAAHRGRHRRIR